MHFFVEPYIEFHESPNISKRDFANNAKSVIKILEGSSYKNIYFASFNFFQPIDKTTNYVLSLAKAHGDYSCDTNELIERVQRRYK